MSARPEPIPLQVPPHSIEMEMSVLGGLLIDNSAFDRIDDVVGDSDFYRDDHRRIFRHIARLIERGELADVVTVDEAIKASEDKDKTGGITYLAALAGNTPSAHNVRRYAEMVREYSERRQLQAAAMDLHDRAARGDLEDAKAELAERVESIRTRAQDWPALDLELLAKQAPERPGFIVPDWGPTGYCWMLAGHGGTGKSQIALMLGCCVAAGVPFFGIELTRRRVMFLSPEDRAGLLHWRLARICAHLGIGLAELRAWMRVVDLVGQECVLWQRDPRTGVTLTSAYERLRAGVKKHQTELLIVDGVADTFGGLEDRGEIKRYVNALLALIPPDRGAVLIISHVAKASAKEGDTSEGYYGNTAWHNAVRARWYLRPETTREEGEDRPTKTGRLVLELQKSNLGPADQSMTFRWDPDAHLFLGQVDGASAFDRKHQDREERAGILRAFKACADATTIVPAAMQGPRTAYLVLSVRPEFPGSLKGSGSGKKQRFRRQIEELRQIRAIAESEYRRSNRHPGSQLALTPEGMRQCAE